MNTKKLTAGVKDIKTVTSGGGRLVSRINGVLIHKLNNVLTRSGILTEIFRSDWPSTTKDVKQVNWVELNSFGTTDWHRHLKQTDRLIGVSGNIKLALLDGREHSPTSQQSEIIRFGIADPVMIVIPPGVWHALKNECSDSSGYLNVINELYDYEDPDNFRVEANATNFPAL